MKLHLHMLLHVPCVLISVISGRMRIEVFMCVLQRPHYFLGGCKAMNINFILFSSHPGVLFLSFNAVRLKIIE